MSDWRSVIENLHPMLAGVVFSHLLHGDDVSVVDGTIAILYGSSPRHTDGPTVELFSFDPDALLSARFNGEPVDEVVLAALVGRALGRHFLDRLAPARGDRPRLRG